MDRYLKIESVTFDGDELPLPVSARLSRQGQPLAMGSDGDMYPTSVQLGRPMVSAEVKIRGTSAAEGLKLGQSGELVIKVLPAKSEGAVRTITIANCVVAMIEIGYEQSSMAVATLRFVAEGTGGEADPFSAEDSE